jgi:hypothetical protein
MGYKPSLFVEGDSIYRSKFTGLLSILIAIISLVSAGYFGSELIIKSTPIVIETSSNFEDFGPYPISNKGIFFMLGMEYQNGTYYTDPTIFEVKATYLIVENVKDETGNINLDFKVKQVEVDICTKYYNQSDILEKNLILPIASLYCVKPDQAVIQGYWGTSGIYSNIRISFTKCINKTENNNHCKPQDIIDATIQNGFISVDYTMFQPNQKNITHPLERVFYDNYNLLNANASLQYAVDLKTQQFKSDDGLVFPEVNIYEGFTHELKIFNSFIRDENIFLIEFHGSHEGKFFLRSYIKLQTVITQIGGFVKFIMLLGSVISTLFSKNLFYIHYLFGNNIFAIKHGNEKNSSFEGEQKDEGSQKISAIKNINVLNKNKKSKIMDKKIKIYKNEDLQNEIGDKIRFPEPENLNIKLELSKTDNTVIPFNKNKSINLLSQINRLDNISNLNNFEGKNKSSGELIRTNKYNKRKESSESLFDQEANHNYISVKILFKYLCGIIFPCKKFKKIDEIYMVNGMEKIFKKALSIDVMVKKFCEVEQMRDLFIENKKDLGKYFSLSVYNTIMKLKEEKSNSFSSKIFIL